MRKLLGLLFILVMLCACDGWDWNVEEPKSKVGYLDYMPDKTQVGANTFGCYINGELAASKGEFRRQGTFSNSAEPWTYKYINGYWNTYSSFFNDPFNKENIDTIMRFDIHLKQAYLSIEFDSLQSNNYKCEFYIQLREQSDLYLTGSTVTTVNITKFDKQMRIISGEFDAIDIPFYYYKDSTVHLTKGQFDIKYGTNF